MAIITDIQRQKKRDSRYSIYLDGNYAFSLSDLELSTSHLQVGAELSEAEVAECQSASEEGKAYNRAISYLTLRKRSRREVSDYLRKSGYASELIDDVIGKLEYYHLIDDEAFVSSWIADRKALKPRSKRHLEQELRGKGVVGQELEAGLAGVSDEDEMSSLEQIIGKKINLPRYSQREKLISYLMSQGFGYDLIKRALAERSD